MNTFELLKPRPGLRVFVSGAAAGIGAAIADAFVQVDARVYICDVDGAAVEKAKERNPKLLAGVADVANREQVDKVIDDAKATLGGLDILVNNAGIAGPTGEVESLQPEDWERTISTNLNSQYYFLRKAVPLLKETSDCPAIIAMSSVAGRLGYAFRTPYASSKWAIVGLVKSLAVELGPSNIRVNAILPGVVEGDRMDSVIAARAESTGVSFDEMKALYLKKISLRRMVTADDVAAMALFLASPAGYNITGQAISVDGNVEYL
ncbi:SDR family oxidoreductase [Trinickia caryophylli]|uniref:NAD(P)-dependent dehydrogenase, short-chain alcohol dehydrogenase family n=1 Tax=Trinickia caryophylli TaxID=28094 RepID=A0A1X7H676_TRICW|nr:SDR family oxidoreductase [Trinickia caryophylli]PMS13325.1 SDR family NAD(P)-dependent oxidoreductase [Trinickia caryophylli]TRX19147.1 SDR family oxidoreductase [Trinickia caryophylli]WQE13555.1 SDR family oxidoreductase [Trinickia caryophylli]SMF80486.1 NAD(P)-dependent dehydrogenase, short-chain alcohol dehydrogenase family [Trinickia caryophylli]GLU33910.1 3-ketoacyl-ACP reductase [Trinickia caryophylli]